MARLGRLAPLLLVLLLSAYAAAAASFTRQKLSLDMGWRFHLNEVDDPAAAILPDYDDSTWRSLNVPHDFVVEGVFDKSADASHGFLFGAVGWYRRTFTLSAEQRSAAVWWITFDGVYRQSSVWVNGQLLGKRASGYATFMYNLTDAVLAPAGEPNTVVVRCDATQWEGWWYEGGGIYRHVWLEGAEPIQFAPYGVFVRADVTGPIFNNVAAATVLVNTTVSNRGSAPLAAGAVQLVSTVRDAAGAVVATVQSALPAMAANSQTEVVQTMALTSAALWSIDSPTLYTLTSQLVHVSRQHQRSSSSSSSSSTSSSRHRQQHRSMVTANVNGDTVTTEFGVRKLQFLADVGFFLNEQPVKVKGMCNHQDFGGVGVAMPDSVHEFRLRMLKDMGVNAVRASHNPQSPEFLSLCDRLGLLVWDEQRLGSVDNNTDLELSTMVRRDRNHVSVFMWSLCNEGSCYFGSARAKQMKALIDSLDGTRPITAAMNGGWFDSDSVAKALDVVGFNYNIGQWDKYHSQFPAIAVTGSETSSAITTRGQYADNQTAGYLSAYDVHAPSWGNFAWRAWQEEAGRGFMEGGFVWTGFDYKGEPTPYSWPCINSHFGVIDIVGFPKDNYFYYRTWWAADRPMLHLFPHWTWPAATQGQPVAVWVYSAAAQVELFLNNQSLGLQTVPRNGHVEWSVKYTPGTLMARGYNNDAAHTLWAEEVIETSGAAAAIQLEIERFSPTTLVGDGQDTTLVTVKVVDAKGRLVPIADDDVKFSVSGRGALLGVGNGDPSSHDPDKADHRRAFAGLCRALLQAALMESGEGTDAVVLTATAAGLKSATIRIPVKAPANLQLAY